MARAPRTRELVERPGWWRRWYGWLIENVWLLRAFDGLRQSFLFAPLAMAGLGALAAVATLWIDLIFGSSLPDLLPQPSVDTVRAVSSTLAGAMMGVIGTTFTITMAVLTLASGQFGPRLLRQFLQDGMAQFTLGAFMATFTFHLSLLALGSTGFDGRSPQLTFSAGLLVACVALVTLIGFIHHVARGVQVDAVIQNIGTDFDDRIQALSGPSPAQPPDRGTVCHDVAAGSAGYLQAVNLGAMADLARDHDLYVVVTQRPGSHLLAHETVLWTSRSADEDLRDKLLSYISIGPRRSATQDVEFALDQLAEIGVRSLSPGINDPYTAERCIDRLTECLCLAVRVGPLPTAVQTGSDPVRLWMRWPSLAELMDSAFNKLRQAAVRDLSGSLRLVDACRRIAASTDDAHTARLCLEHGQRVRRGLDPEHMESHDRDEFLRRMARLEETA